MLGEPIAKLKALSEVTVKSRLLKMHFKDKQAFT